MRRYLSTLGKNCPKIHEGPSAGDMVILFICRAKNVHCGTGTKPLHRMNFAVFIGKPCIQTRHFILNIPRHVLQFLQGNKICFGSIHTPYARILENQSTRNVWKLFRRYDVAAFRQEQNFNLFFDRFKLFLPIFR